MNKLFQSIKNSLSLEGAFLQIYFPALLTLFFYYVFDSLRWLPSRSSLEETIILLSMLGAIFFAALVQVVLMGNIDDAQNQDYHSAFSLYDWGYHIRNYIFAFLLFTIIIFGIERGVLLLANKIAINKFMLGKIIYWIWWSISRYIYFFGLGLMVSKQLRLSEVFKTLLYFFDKWFLSSIIVLILIRFGIIGLDYLFISNETIIGFILGNETLRSLPVYRIKYALLPVAAYVWAVGSCFIMNITKYEE
ncbi:MAG: hypothetical protein ACOCQR_00665 [bacterium]